PAGSSALRTPQGSPASRTACRRPTGEPWRPSRPRPRSRPAPIAPTCRRGVVGQARSCPMLRRRVRPSGERDSAPVPPMGEALRTPAETRGAPSRTALEPHERFIDRGRVSLVRASPSNDPGPQAPRRAWVWLAFAAATLVIASAATLVNLGRYLTVDEVRMPDLVGMPYDAAVQVLRREGLDPVTFVEYVAGVAANTVSSQTPEPGAIVKRSRTVHLGVNTPPAEARIPDMIGMREEDAIRRAADLNLPIGTVRYTSDARAAGTVVDHMPEGGGRLGPGERLELVVS